LSTKQCPPRHARLNDRHREQAPNEWVQSLRYPLMGELKELDLVGGNTDPKIVTVTVIESAGKR
jgi:hypothetical protein